MSETTDAKEDTIPFYPDHVTTEFYVALGMLVILVIIGLLGVLFPVGLGDPADPMNTPEHTKPEWYFLFLYELLKYIPKTAGAVAPVIAVLILIFWPFIDRKPDKSTKVYRTRFIIVSVLALAVIILTILGEVS